MLEYLLPIMSLLIFFICCLLPLLQGFHECCKSCQLFLHSRSNPLAQEHVIQHPLAPSVDTEEGEKQARRLEILTTVVHKKVLAKDDAKDELAHPHLAELSKRSLHEIRDVDNGSNTKQHNKTNLFVDFTSWRSSRRSAGVGIESSEDEESANLYSPKSCPICLEPYRKGDDICWSQNENCAHAYHLDCMLDWLMNSDDCPLCRADYLKVENGDGGS